MRLRVLVLAAATILGGASPGRAQGTTYAWLVAVSAAQLTAALPLLTAESSGTVPGLDELAQVGMTRQEYTTIKDCLLVARADALRPTRLQGLAAAALQVRQANLRLYLANKAKLDPVLARLTIVPVVADDTPAKSLTR